jgi:amino acid adenylation domain-containing protein
MFAEAVARHPELPAIAGEADWTYARLAEAVAGTVKVLRERGMRPGDVVAVTGARAPELVAAMLAVFDAGGILLPVDPALPGHRRRLMAERAEWLLEPGAVTALRDAPLVARPPDAAYVFFTSGTTGTPNPVLGGHQGLSHFLSWQRNTFAVGPGDRCAQLTGLSFDVVLRDMFLPLVSGATLCLPPADLPVDDVLAWLEQDGITLLHTVPTVAEVWLSAARRVSCAPLRVVFFAGEPLPGELVERWRAAHERCDAVVNLYGPTETTLAKCFHVVADLAPPGIQPLGRPLPETQVVVLGEGDRLCAPGASGELAISTPFRTHGYLDGGTPERFVPNPWGEGDLFRTGDRGRYNSDGLLEFLGRLDDQVKVLGVRVEPAEVTAVLLGHPGVAAAAVVPAERGLHAYYVPRAALPASDVRTHLADRLPAPMAPSAFTAVDRLPTTANGKLDRAALAPPPVPTAGSLEAELAEIWDEVLDVSQVGRDDDFFELGGHSLLAARMLSRVRKRFGIQVPLRRLLKSSTLAAFATEVSGAVKSEAPAIPRLPRDPE